MTHTNELERMNARNSHIWPEGGVTSGRARRGRLFYKMITAWVILCMVVCGCATKELGGSAQDVRIAQIVKEEGARIEKEHRAHVQLVKEQEKKIRTQMPIR